MGSRREGDRKVRFYRPRMDPEGITDDGTDCGEAVIRYLSRSKRFWNISLYLFGIFIACGIFVVLPDSSLPMKRGFWVIQLFVIPMYILMAFGSIANERAFDEELRELCGRPPAE